MKIRAKSLESIRNNPKVQFIEGRYGITVEYTNKEKNFVRCEIKCYMFSDIHNIVRSATHSNIEYLVSDKQKYIYKDLIEEEII